jgi:hypothetical protein
VQCHDFDNDVTWKYDLPSKEEAFPRKWRKIAHPTVQGE